MKIFELNEEVEGMKPCMKKPIPVYAIQINEPFRVKSLEGDYAQGKKGDFLMKGVNGENYICDQEIFNKSYNWVEKDKDGKWRVIKKESK
jgi:hypothetical protein